MLNTWSQFNQGWLPVSPRHQIYYAEYGDPDGIPILSIHGGPGSQSKLSHLEVLPPGVRAILFDQRGCGLSKPFGELKQNTTQNLISDMDKLRRHLNIDKWILVGNSWGSTLALLYAETYPQHTLGLGLRSVFLARPQDVLWSFSRQGAGRFYPDGWHQLEIFAKTHNFQLDNLLDQGWHILTQTNQNLQNQFVQAIRQWEWHLMKFEKDPSQLPPEITPEDIAMTKLFWHYWKNDFFLKPNQILTNLSTINHLPAVIVHGRYDLDCPPEQAWQIHQNLPKSELFFSSHASHHLNNDAKLWFRKLLSSLLLIV